MSDHPTDPLTEAAAAAIALRDAGERFVAVAGDLRAAAELLADAETRARLACGRAGIPAPQPPARELAADVLAASAAPLRPWTPFVTREAGHRAAEALTRFRPPVAD